MINITNPKDCSGCTACDAICPKDAITMEPDALGFLYPKVNLNLCIDCGLCEKVCAFNENYDKSANLEEPVAYGARHKNMAEVETSRSGAAFIAISDYILSEGGTVYGAGYADGFRVVHKRSTNKTERDEFKGSKYTQSDITGIFRLIKKDLKNGITVLFSGTPCQTAGLSSYLPEKLKKNLVLLDIVCHGVTSPYIWRDYLKYIEKKHGLSIKSVDFRDKKECGWKAQFESFTFENNKKKITSWFRNVMTRNLALRQSCHICPYTNTTRPSDLTIADFWGWEKTNPEANADDKGISLILCNTEKGIAIFDKLKTDLYYFPVIKGKYTQPRLLEPNPPNEEREKFELYYNKNGFNKTYKKYTFEPGLLQKCFVKAKRIPNKIKSYWRPNTF